MNTLEINAVADTLLGFLQKQSEHPLDAIVILGVTLIKLHAAAQWSKPVSIEKFAQDFHDSLIETAKDKKEFHPGSEGVQ